MSSNHDDFVPSSNHDDFVPSSNHDDFVPASDRKYPDNDIPEDERTIWDGPDAPTAENIKRKLIDKRAKVVDRQVKAYLTELGHWVNIGGDPLEFAATIYRQLQMAKAYIARAQRHLKDDWGDCPECFTPIENWGDDGYAYCVRTGCEWIEGSPHNYEDENDF